MNFENDRDIEMHMLEINFLIKIMVYIPSESQLIILGTKFYLLTDNGSSGQCQRKSDHEKFV